MGRYPLVVLLYKDRSGKKSHRFLWRFLCPFIVYTHVGIAVGDAHYWFAMSKGSYLTTNKAIHKIRTFDTCLFLGFVEVNKEILKDSIPTYPPYRPIDLIKWGVARHFKVFNYFGCKRPKLCTDMVCNVLNFYNIPIPNYGGQRIGKIRRWLYENNFVLWEGRYRKDDNSKRTNGSSV